MKIMIRANDLDGTSSQSLITTRFADMTAHYY